MVQLTRILHQTASCVFTRAYKIEIRRGCFPIYMERLLPHIYGEVASPNILHNSEEAERVKGNLILNIIICP